MKKKMIKEGLLDAKGRPNEKTPETFLKGYTNYAQVKQESVETPAVIEEPASFIKQGSCWSGGDKGEEA